MSNRNILTINAMNILKIKQSFLLPLDGIDLKDRKNILYRQNRIFSLAAKHIKDKKFTSSVIKKDSRVIGIRVWRIK